MVERALGLLHHTKWQEFCWNRRCGGVGGVISYPLGVNSRSVVCIHQWCVRRAAGRTPPIAPPTPPRRAKAAGILREGRGGATFLLLHPRGSTSTTLHHAGLHWRMRGWRRRGGAGERSSRRRRHPAAGSLPAGSPPRRPQRPRRSVPSASLPRRWPLRAPRTYSPRETDRARRRALRRGPVRLRGGSSKEVADGHAAGRRSGVKIRLPPGGARGLGRLR